MSDPGNSWDVAIIGAGAAGLAAGIFAAEANPAARVVVLDGATKVGAKILVAGGGRCNVTHCRVTPEDFNAASRSFVRNVLASFTVEQTIDWFATMGVELKREETGKLFPTTDKARTVLDALLTRLRERGGTLLTDHRVTGISLRSVHDRAQPVNIASTAPTAREDAGPPTDHSAPNWTPRQGEAAGSSAGSSTPRFEITTSQGPHIARRLILATGGRSLPKTGSDGGGYELARSLGHTVTHTHAALVPMVLQQHFFHASLSGVSHEAEITTLVDGKPADRRTGSLLWTHFGVSGPLAMDASRHWIAARDSGTKPQWVLSFLPDETFEAVEQALVAASADAPRTPLRRFLVDRWGGQIPERFIEALLAWLKLDGSAPLSQLKREDRRALVHGLLELPLPVEQERGWNYAEVTAGGVPLDEVSWRTMSSRIVPGLHLAGEILDVDGRIGGFNFQWAWATGLLAGRAAAMTSPSQGC